MTLFRKAFSAAGYNFRMWRKNPRIYITFGLGAVLCFLLSEKIMTLTVQQGTVTQILEPFIWIYGDSGSILLASALLVLLFADMPFLSSGTPFYLVRMDRKTWLLGQGLYVVGATFLYMAFLLVATVLLCARNSFSGDMWSNTAVLLGFSQAGERLFLPSSTRTMERTTPYPCAGTIFLLMLLYALLLAFFMLLLNLRRGQRAGIVGAIGFSVYGFLLDPKVFIQLLGISAEREYQVNVALGWLSPLNHATYPMHNFGLDLLPTLWETAAIFLGLILLCFLGCVRAARQYSFSFTGTEGML